MKAIAIVLLSCLTTFCIGQGINGPQTTYFYKQVGSYGWNFTGITNGECVTPTSGYQYLNSATYGTGTVTTWTANNQMKCSVGVLYFDTNAPTGTVCTYNVLSGTPAGSMTYIVGTGLSWSTPPTASVGCPIDLKDYLNTTNVDPTAVTFSGGGGPPKLTGSIFNSQTAGISAIITAFPHYKNLPSGSFLGSANTTVSVVDLAVSTNPINTATCLNGSATFTGAASGGSKVRNYQWYESPNGGTTWSSLTDNSTYSGANTGTLNITNPGLSRNGYKYYLKVDDGCKNVTTSVGTLTIYGIVSITSSPSNSIVCQGSGSASTTFTGNGTASNGVLNYQWQVSSDGGSTWNNISNNSNYSGSTTATLTVTPPVTFNGYKYRLYMSDACGNVSSNITASANLTVYGPVTVLTNPSNQSFCVTGGPTFTVLGNGSNGVLNYQWQESSNAGSTWSNLTNGGVYSGANTNSLTLTGVTPAYDNYQYKALITDGCGAATQVYTTAAVLRVYGNIPITLQPSTVTVCPSGTNTSFTVSATPQNGPASYQWGVSSNAGSTWSDLSNGGVYGGVTSPTLMLSALAPGYKNNQYRVKVSDLCGLITQVTSNPATLLMYNAVTIISNPVDKVICPNGNTTFSVSGNAPGGSLGYQWQVSTNGGTSYSDLTNGGIYSGVTSVTLTLTTATLANNGMKFRAVLTDACGVVNQVISNAATLTVNTTVNITTQPNNQAVCISTAGAFSVAATGTGASYLWQESSDNGTTWTNLTDVGLYSGTTTSTLTISNLNFSYNNKKYRCIVTGTCSSSTSNAATLTINLAPSITADPVAITRCEGSSGSLTVSASGSSIQYLWQYSTTGGIGSFNDIAGSTSSTYTLSSPLISNAGSYRAKVYNTCGTQFSSGVPFVVNPSVKITTQPTNAGVCPGATTSLSVLAGGTGPYSYQWMKDPNTGTYANIVGQTNSTLNIANATSSDGANYKVVISGGCGTPVTSSLAIITVNPIPAQPIVLDVARCGNGALSTTASSSAPSPTYKWYTNLSDIIPQSNGATYTISNLTLTTSYFVSVTSLSCESSKKMVTFTRNAPQQVPLGSDLSLCIGQGFYNLENDITDPIAKGNNFTWIANATNFSSKIFDPSVGSGSYTISYDPPTLAKSTPYCYLPTTRTINVVSTSGSGGIVFNNPLITNGNTLNSCVGDNPIDISTFPSITGGSWTTVTGTGLSFSGSAVVFTPDQNSYTAINPNVFRYTAISNGCTASKDLNVFVKNNDQKAIVTGIPAVVCPGIKITLSATVSSPGTYTYEWVKPGQSIPFSTDASVNYTVTNAEVLQVRSINLPFGCRSDITLANIVTPFNSSQINVDKSLIAPGDPVKFTTDASSNGNTFNWKFGDGGTSVEREPLHYFYDIGKFTIQLSITSSLGCSQSLKYESITVDGLPINVITGISSNDPDEKISVFPNPFTTELHIKSGVEINDVSLIDITGKTMNIEKIKDGREGHDFSINVYSLSEGIYFLKIEKQNSVDIFKIYKN